MTGFDLHKLNIVQAYVLKVCLAPVTTS